MTASATPATVVPLVDVLALGPAAWDALGGAPAGSPFATWAWHHAWAEAAPPADVRSSRALVLRSSGGDLAACLPFRTQRRRFRRAPVTALEWAIGDLGCPDHLDVAARPDADLGALVQALDDLPWDVILLDNVAAQAPNSSRLLAACAARGWSARRTPLWRCPFLVLPPTWDDYLATLSASRRQTIRRKERSLLRDHAVELVQYDETRRADGWEWLTRLHGRRWGGDGALGGPVVERLHRAFGAALDEDAVWLFTLDVNGTPVAAWYGFAYGDTVSYYQGGWDPRWERCSVGAVLMGMMIRRAIERGYRVFDFLRGEEAYKRTWTSTFRWCDQLAVIRSGWRGTTLRVLDWVGTRRALSRAAATPDQPAED